MSATDMAQGQTQVTTSTTAAAELDRRLAGLSPRVDPAVEDRTCVVAPSGEDARCDRGARPGLADRDERSVGRELDGAEREETVGDVAAAGDVARIALVLLADVDQLGARLEDLVELLDPDELEVLRAATEDVPRDVEDADRAQVSASPRADSASSAATTTSGCCESSTNAAFVENRVPETGTLTAPG